ncbi:phosphatase PAP2 family protein [Streptomyces sp. G-G2]|uniref:phosphatase PAP2 family protein n=1 Tax=Streptomyces sp. G-G2 TaxID=3046201 RepID=UPI0024B8CAB3|nr:phosphatase PAP2 family protein [Streptomyces sp. G-G2]MDJ0381164.1 phosphatase PAP2 family protein [Streptomyces sp. G-G2]
MTGDRERRSSSRTGTLIGGVCVLLAAALTALVVVDWSPLLSLDGRVARGLHGYAVGHPGVTGAVRFLSDWVWDPWTMRALTALACLWLWRRGERVRAWWCAAAVLVAAAVQQGLKAAVGRTRPVWPDPVDSGHFAAYPSGHALTATVVCGLLLWLAPRSRAVRAAAWAAALVSVAGVGFTRVYLGVHWLSDVAGGWLLGAALAAFTIGAVGRAGGAGGGLAPSGTAGGGRSPASPTTNDSAR